jgi:SpoVK/Ycf46/Vps4 family AAA+-type ATPase
VHSEHELEVASDVVAPHEITVTFEDIGGLREIGSALQRNIILPFTRPELFKQSKLLCPPKGVLLHGPPGTGKTLLARAVAREAKFTFICLNPARLLSKWYGESNKFAEAYFGLANKLAPSILFIDEIDCLFRTRGGGGGGGHEHEATSMLKAQFLSLWDGLLAPSAPQVVVIAATNRPGDVDPAVLRRLPLSFQIDLPQAAEREDVLRLLLRDEPLARAVDLTAIAAATDGYSGSDLDQLCKTAAMRSLDDALEGERAASGAASSAVPTPEPITTGDEEAAQRQGSGDNGAELQPSSGAMAREELAGAHSSAPAAVTLDPAVVTLDPPPPPLLLRPLTLEDFLSARQVVRPTRGRFSGVHHEMGHAQTTLAPEPYDEELYD